MSTQQNKQKGNDLPPKTNKQPRHMPLESDRGSSLVADDADVGSNSNFIASDDHQAKVGDTPSSAEYQEMGKSCG